MINDWCWLIYGYFNAENGEKIMKNSNYIPRRGDKAKFVNHAPAKRYYCRWANVEKGGSENVILSYPKYLRISKIKASAARLLFYRGGLEFTVPS